MARKTPFLLLALAMAATAAAPMPPVPEEVPDWGPAVSERVERGSLVLTEVAPIEPSEKEIDGDPSDWIGTSARVAGNSHFSAGEFIHTDFLFDAYGADDGGDIDRWNDFAHLLYVEERTERLDDLLRTSGSQLGVPEPLGADDEYGDADRSLAEGDLTELRIAADDDELQFLVRTSNMTEPSRLGVLVLGRLGEYAYGQDGILPGYLSAGGGVFDGFGSAVLIAADGSLRAFTGFTEVPEVEVAVEAVGWSNTLEFSLDGGPLVDGGVVDIAVVTGRFDDTARFVPLNIAFRHAEPVDIYNDRMQAFALHGDAPDGSRVSDFTSGPVALADLEAGRTQTWELGPGYHEVLFTSGENISREVNKDSLTQHYGLYVPEAYDAPEGDPVPATFWMHYRGGKAHSAAAINPRLVHDHGPNIGTLFVSPRGRGTSTWYVTQAHQDFFEVYDDVHARFPTIDPQRRYLSGYSMGGYGTWLMSTLYPDLFAAGFAVSGAVTQGAWTGVLDEGEECERLRYDDESSACYLEANGGDAAAQLTYRLLENLQHFPIAFDHGTDDELVPLPQIERMAARLTELGYEHRLTRFLGYEHFTQAIMEEWRDGTEYLVRHRLPENPRTVTYKVVPALVEALNTVRKPDWQARFDHDPDGAWWIDDVEVRDPDVEDVYDFGLVEATSWAIEAPTTVAIPDPGAASPIHHSTPFVRTGLAHLELAQVPQPIENRLSVTATGVASLSIDTVRAAVTSDVLERLDVETDGRVEITLRGFGRAWADVAGGGVAVRQAGSDLVLTVEASTTITFT